MRYLLHESQLNELAARRVYLYDIFRLYFLPRNQERGYIPFIPLGTKDPDVLFITGHTDQVQDYLENMIDYIPEKSIVITSCFGMLFHKYISKKDIYVPNSCLIYCPLRDGKPFGFDFFISDAELDFYNAAGDTMARIQTAYERL